MLFRSLLKACYGLRQAPRAFNAKLRQTLLSLGLTASVSDPCLFFRPPPNRFLAAFYVDDAILASTRESDIKEFIEQLKRTFDITTEPLRFFLGAHITISEDRKSISLSQTRYIEDLLQRFQLTDCKGVSTPTDSTITTAYQSEIDQDLPYRSLIGSIMYAAQFTRGDISFAVSKLSRYLDKPTKPLYAAGLRVLKYLKATKNFGPRYTADQPADFICYCDADHAGDADTRKSTSGALFKFGGGAVGWCSTLQKATALSSTDAEIYSLSNAVRNCVWWTRVLDELGYPVKPVIRMDSTPAIHIVMNEQISPKAKHIAIRHFFVREKLAAGELSIEHVDTEVNESDAFTKNLGKLRFQKLRELAGFNGAASNSNSHGGRHGQ